MSESPFRKRDAGATRESILEAAKQLFLEKGFDATGVREIAMTAGVNAALVNRYFGSKDALFEEAVLPTMDIGPLLEGDKATFGTRVADHMARKKEADYKADPTLLLLRSIASPAVGPTVNRAIETALVGKLAKWLGGANAQQRAALIVSQLLGFDMLHRVVGAKALGKRHTDDVVQRLGAVLQSYVDG